MYQILLQNLTPSIFGTLDIYMFMLPENCTHGKFHQKKIPPMENPTQGKIHQKKIPLMKNLTRENFFWEEISLT